MTHPRRRRLAIIIAVTGVAAAVAPLTAAGQAKARLPREKFVSLISHPEDWVGGGVDRVFRTGNARIRMDGGPGIVEIRAEGGSQNDYFDLTFAAPEGERLRRGYYDRAQRFPFQAATRPGIDVSGDGRGCNEISGRFDIKDIAITGDGTIKKLWLTFQQHCEGGDPALVGEVRIGYPSPPRGSRHMWFPRVDVDTSMNASITFVADAALTVDPVAMGGRHASSFVVTNDSCTSRSLDAGQACRVVVRFQPTGGGPRFGTLNFGTSQGSHKVALEGEGIAGRTQIQFHSPPGESIGDGQDWSYDRTNADIVVGASRRRMGGRIDGFDDSWWFFDFEAPRGDIFVPGETYEATRWPFNFGAGMDVSGNGNGCNELHGDFTITSLSIATDGTLRYVGLRFNQYCGKSTIPLSGKIEFRVPTTEITPPAPVSNLRWSRTGEEAQLSWTDPSDADHAYTVVRALEGSTAPGAISSGHLAYADDGTSTTVRGRSDRALSVAVYTVDSNGNVGRPVRATIPREDIGGG